MLTHQPALQIDSMGRAELLAVLAHELRNPIGAIRNAVILLESASKLPGAMDHARRLIARQLVAEP